MKAAGCTNDLCTLGVPGQNGIQLGHWGKNSQIKDSRKRFSV